MANKTYDRAQVLQVAAQLYPYYAEQVEASIEEEDMDCAADYSAQAARSLIDAVERQCPLPGKPEATLPPLPRQGRRITP